MERFDVFDETGKFLHLIHKDPEAAKAGGVPTKKFFDDLEEGGEGSAQFVAQGKIVEGEVENRCGGCLPDRQQMVDKQASHGTFTGLPQAGEQQYFRLVKAGAGLGKHIPLDDPVRQAIYAVPPGIVQEEYFLIHSAASLEIFVSIYRAW
jgi:hypothetical protein